MQKEELAKRAYAALEGHLTSCRLCRHQCGVNRDRGERGKCGAGDKTHLYGARVHMGEEPPISGTRGSGTLFFSGCSLECIYCQNYLFSTDASSGQPVTPRQLADEMISLQQKEVHNVNLVTPTHYLPQIIRALGIAFSMGLNIPIIYNTVGYDDLRCIASLDGLVDIYLPDIRYSEDINAVRYSGAEGYVDNSREVVKEMYRQVGKLSLKDFLAERGVLIRLLLLPGDVSGIGETLDFIAREIGRDAYLSVMTQYRPFHRAFFDDKLRETISGEYYDDVLARMEDLGMRNGWFQKLQGGFDDSLYGQNLF